MNPRGTVFDAKRLIGRRFDDEEVKKDMKTWPFKVVDKDGAPSVEVEYLGETRQFTPAEISAMVLSKLKDTAEAKVSPDHQLFLSLIPAHIDSLHRSARPSRRLSLPSQLTSTTLSVYPPRMPVPLPVLMFSESSTSPPLPPLLTVSTLPTTRTRRSEPFSFSI